MPRFLREVCNPLPLPTWLAVVKPLRTAWPILVARAIAASCAALLPAPSMLNAQDETEIQS
eukprot:6175927-Pleurochrysis_carterae.AAC.4